MKNTNKNLIFGDESQEEKNKMFAIDEYLEPKEYFDSEKNEDKSNISGDNIRSGEMGQEGKIMYSEEKEVIYQISPVEVFTVKKKLLKIKGDIEEILKVLNSKVSVNEEKLVFHSAERDGDFEEAAESIEGIFDGTRMIAQSGEKFNVPPNYASKSKLVEGDILKLRIMANGVFKYKQIEKVERRNVIGILGYNEETREYFVILENGKKYHVLPASITYYKAKPGDEVIITIPKDKDSVWASVENVNNRY